MTAIPGTIRPAAIADAAAIAQVRVDAWRDTYRGMIPDAYLANMSVPGSTAVWQRILNTHSDRTSVFVAEDASGVIGFASGNLRDPRKLGFDAELSAIYVRPERQRGGIGRRLVSVIAAARRAQGATGLIVWLIAGNKAARAFYEALGGELLVEQPFQWDGLDLVEAGYGFRDLNALAAIGGANPALH